MKRPESILIIKLSAIGDVVHSLPFLEVLRKNFPSAKIDWLVEEDSYDIIRGHEAINRIMVSPRREITRSWKKVEMWGRLKKKIEDFLKELRSTSYDLVIDLQGLLKSAVLMGFSRGKRKIGLLGSREGARYFSNNPPLPVNLDQHAIDRYLEAAYLLGCDLFPWKGRIPLSTTDKTRAEEILNISGIDVKGPIVAINPMARWETKLWEEERFASLADLLTLSFGYQVVFTGSNQDRVTVTRILERMNTRAVSLAGKTTLKELAYLYSICRVVVTTDTGPMHIAAAMGTRVVALFGPTSPRLTGPYGAGHRIVRTEMECMPCFRKQCREKHCMRSISVDQVVEAIRGLNTDQPIFKAFLFKKESKHVY